MVAADHDRRGLVAPLHSERARRRRRQRARLAPRETNPLALHIHAGGAEQSKRLRIAAELDADFAEEPVRLGLERGERLLAKRFVRGDAARNQSRGRPRASVDLTSARPSKPPAAASGFVPRLAVIVVKIDRRHASLRLIKLDSTLELRQLTSSKNSKAAYN